MSYQSWRTPPEFFLELDQEFHFTVDVAASDNNALLPRYYIASQDGLAQDWSMETIWCNPPYTDVLPWVRKAAASRFLGATTVLLLNSSTDTAWFHDYVWDNINHCPRPHVQIRFLRGRLQFQDELGNPGLSPTKPNMLVIFGPGT